MGLIVVATDGSPSAGAALDAAIDLGREAGHELAIVTVWQALQGDFGLAYPPTAVLPELLDAERGHAETTLADARRRAEAAGLTVETHLLAGDPARTVCRFAHDRGARLIACGTHGYGAMLSLLMGSVSHEIIRQAPCAVLVTHESATDDQSERERAAAVGRRR